MGEKKSRSAEKNESGEPLVSPGMVCYAEKQEKLFWFSSLGQIMQFGAIIFCRTFKNYFGQFVWIEKETSRDRPKSAPYPRLKNSKKTSKCQVFVYSSRKSKIFRNFFLKKLHTKKMDPGALTSDNAEKLKGGTL